MKKNAFCLPLLIIFALFEARAFDFRQQGETFTVSGKRIELTVRKAALVLASSGPIAFEDIRIQSYPAQK